METTKENVTQTTQVEELSSKENQKRKYEHWELFEKDMHFVTDTQKVSACAKLVFSFLRRFGGEKHCAIISLKTLAKKLGWTIPTVMKYIKELIEANIVRKERTVRADGGHGCNRYYLSFDLNDWFREEDFEAFPKYRKDFGENGKNRDNEIPEQKESKATSSASATTTTDVTLQPEPNEVNTCKDTYSLDFIKEHYNIEWLKENCFRWGINKHEVEATEQVLFDVLNTKSSYTFKIKGREIVANIVKSQFLKLNSYSISYSLKKIAQCKNAVADYTGYLISTLYTAAVDAKMQNVAAYREIGLEYSEEPSFY